MNKIFSKQRTHRHLPGGWRGDARPAAFGAAIAALLAFILLVPTAWTEIARPQAGSAATRIGAASGDDCKVHTVGAVPTSARQVATDEQFMAWAVAAHRSAASGASFTTLAAARAISADNRN